MLFFRQWTNPPLFLIRNGHEVEITFSAKQFFQSPHRRHRLDGGAGLGNHQKQHMEPVARPLPFPVDAVRQFRKAHGIHILAGEVHLRVPLPLFLRHFIPVGAAEKVEERLVPQVGATDADGNEDIGVLRPFPESQEPLLLLLRNKQVLLQKIRQVREKHRGPIGPLPGDPDPLHRLRRPADVLTIPKKVPGGHIPFFSEHMAYIYI